MSFLQDNTISDKLGQTSKTNVEIKSWSVCLICTLVAVICFSVNLLIYCTFSALWTFLGKLIWLLMASLLLTLAFQQITFLVVGSQRCCVAKGYQIKSNQIK